jgi:hypothetical protein
MPTKPIAFTLAALAFTAGTAFADRAPTPEEAAQIEATLKEQGYVSWEEIEMDDGMWEVDDARDAQGREFDLKLDPRTLKIVEKDD